MGEMPFTPKQVSLPPVFEGPSLHSFNRQTTTPCFSGLPFPSLQIPKDKNFGKVWISPELQTEIALKNELGKQAKKSMDPNKWMEYCKQQTKIQSLIANAKEDQLKDSEQDMNIDKPWVTDEVKNEILKKRQLRKWAMESDDPDLFTQFREQRRKVVTLVQQAKAAYKKKKPAALGIPPQSQFPLAGPMHTTGGMLGSPVGSTFQGLDNQPFQRQPVMSREQQIIDVGPPTTSEASTENEEDMDKPWITPELKSEMTFRHTICQQAVETSDPNLWREYRNQRKTVKQMLKKAKLAYEERTEAQVVNFAKAWLSAELESEVIRKNKLHKDATKTMNPDVWTEFHDQSTKVKLLLNKVKQIHQWMAPSVKVQEANEDKAWVTDELKYAVIKKKKLCQLATETMDPVLYLEYREQYKRLEKLLQETRSCYYGKAGETQYYLDTDQLNELYGPLQKCGRIGCEFKAQEKIVEFHMRMAHESGLIENILQLDSPEEIEMWKEEMKKSARSGQGMLFLGGVRGYDTLNDAVALAGSMARVEPEANQMFHNINDTNPLPGLPMGDPRQGTLSVTMALQPPAVQEESKIDPLFYSHSGTSREGEKQIVTLDASRNFPSALIRSVGNVRDNRMLNSVPSQETASIGDKRQKQFHKRDISDQEGKKETPDRKLSPARHHLSPEHPLRRSRSPLHRSRSPLRHSRSPLRRSRSPLHHHPGPLCRKSSPIKCSRPNLSEDEMVRFHSNSLQNKYSFRSEGRQDKGLNRDAQNSLCAAVDFITSRAKEFGQAAIPTKEVLSRAMALQVLKRAKDSDNVQIQALREQLFVDFIKNEFGESFAEKFRNVSKREFSPPSCDRAMRHDGARMRQEQRREKYRPHP